MSTADSRADCGIDCEIYDVIVVGAGIQGSSTAFNIASKGHASGHARSLLLEQVRIGSLDIFSHTINLKTLMTPKATQIPK